MVRLFLALALVLTFQFCPAAAASLYAQSKIVAIVNSDVITQKDLGEFVNFMRIQLSREYSGKELEQRIQTLDRDLLLKLIEDRLIMQEAKKAGIVVDPSRIKDRLDEMKKQYGSESVFQEAIVKQGLVQADIENKIREQILMYAVIETKVRSKITIRPSEVTDLYNSNPQKFLTSEERVVDVITGPGDAAAFNSIYRELAGGKKMPELVFRYPLEVNELAVSQNGEFRKEITDAVFGMGISGISKPVSIDNKYYIFSLKAIVPSRRAALSEVKDRIRSFLLEEKMREDLSKFLNDLKKQSYIKIL